jgi:putative ABC transport system permease protein
MNVLKIALRNARGNPLKSAAVFLCVFGVAAFLVATLLVITGAQGSLDRGLERLGADILVLPTGAEDKMESALLLGSPIKMWMPEVNLNKVAGVEGVAQASPQIYLQSLLGAHCCAVSEMFVVVFDPKTDFSVTPWLKEKLGRDLTTGEVIGGTHVFLPEGDKYIRLYGYDLTLMGTLEPTGIGIDSTMFMDLETAKAVSQTSLQAAEAPLEVPTGLISSVLVKVAPGADPHKVAIEIERRIQGVAAVESPDLFGSFREQMLGLLGLLVVMIVLAYLLSTVTIGMVFSMAAHERRREMAVLRATGATPFFVFRTLWTEAALLALAGSVAGVFCSSLLIFVLRDYIAASLHMPFLFPSFGVFVGLVATTLALALLTVSIAVFLPAYRISRQEPALAMKE